MEMEAQCLFVVQRAGRVDGKLGVLLVGIPSPVTEVPRRAAKVLMRALSSEDKVNALVNDQRSRCSPDGHARSVPRYGRIPRGPRLTNRVLLRKGLASMAKPEDRVGGHVRTGPPPGAVLYRIYAAPLSALVRVVAAAAAAAAVVIIIIIIIVVELSFLKNNYC